MKVLLASHSPTLATGYGRVVREIAGGLVGRGHELTVVGLGALVGRPHTFPFNIRPASFSLVAGVIEALNDDQYDTLLTVGDPWMFEGLPEALSSVGHRPRWVAYFPIDGAPLPRAWAEWVLACDVPVVFSEFARDVVARAIGLAPDVVYHGVDLATFSPGDMNDAKRRVVGDDRAFVVGCVAANQQRKNLPALVKAFATFAIDKPEALLYLHTPLVGCWDVGELVEQHGIEPKTRLTLGLTPDGSTGAVDDATLATIYRSFDVFVLPTMAEGFGLPLVEAQACGVPTLATDSSACRELLPDPYQRVRVQSKIVMARNFEQDLIDERELAEKLNVLYHDPAKRNDLATRALESVKKFDWTSAVRQLGERIEHR